MELKIEYLSKDQVKPYAQNAKIHTHEQIEQIKKSIKEFGFNDPIAIWHENEIIEGHGRLLAVMEMEDIKDVPVIRLDELSDSQRKAYMLAHNKLTMNTGFDFEVLADELKSITDFDMKDFGFEDIHLDSFFEDMEEEKEEPDKDADEEFRLVCHCEDQDIYNDLIAYLKERNIRYEAL